MNTKTNDLKEVIKRWIVNIDKTEELPSDIVALSFNLNELADLNIFRVEHIAVGFVDGDLIIIK